jgi:hypothetical protein
MAFNTYRPTKLHFHIYAAISGSCLPMVNGSLRVLRLLPPLKLVAMIDIAEILLKVALSTINQINQIESIFNRTTNCSNPTVFITTSQFIVLELYFVIQNMLMFLCSL